MSLLIEKWLWLLILALITILVLPGFIILILLKLPFPSNMIGTVLIIVAYGIASGLKEYASEHPPFHH